MRKSVLFLAILSLVTLFTACEEEHEVVAPGRVVIHAGMEGAVRVAFDSDGKFSWSSGDEIAVMTSSGSFKTFSIISGEGTSKADFAADLDPSESIGSLAVYPASSAVSLSGSVLKINLPKDHEFSSDGKIALPMIASIDSKESAAFFRHVGGVMRIIVEDVPAEARTFVFTSPNLRIYGDFRVADVADPEATISAAALSGGSSISFTLPSPCPSPLTVDVPLPTGTYNGFSVELQDASGTLIPSSQKSSSKSFEVARKSLIVMTPYSTGPEQELALLTDSQIGIRWSVNSFANISADAADAYVVGVYSDKACENLLWQWTVSEKGGGQTSLYNNGTGYIYNWGGSASKRLFQPGLILSGLSPETTYYVKVTDTVLKTSSVREYKTAASDVHFNGTTASANEGEVILRENFNEFTYGGDPVLGLSGYSSTSRKNDAPFILPQGEDPKGTNSALYLVSPNIHMGLFNTVAKEVDISRLSTWKAYAQNNLAGAICVQSGIIKIGASSCTGDIVTPELDCLKETATLRVSFDAAPYYEWAATTTMDGLTSIVDVFPKGASIANTYWLDFTSVSPIISKEVAISDDPAFRRYTVLLEDVPVGSRIGIGAKLDNNAGSTQHRCYIDNVTIELVSYGASNPSELNGTAINPLNNAYGLVTNSETGSAIPGIPVTDGYSYTTTDANGVYQMKLDSRARNVYLSIPSEYEIPLDPATGFPLFYSTGAINTSGKNRFDFALRPLSESEKSFTFIAIGDPQCKTTSNVNRYKSETIPDIKSTIGGAQSLGSYKRPYAMTLGDIIFDSTNMWDNMKSSMSNVRSTDGIIPFFQCIGNHDHTSTTTSDYAATAHYVRRFGPTDYSFNRGDVHIVVMDNVVCTTTSSNSSPDGATWKYNAGYSDEQYQWLVEDLSYVKDKGSKMIFFCGHIPFRGGSASGGSNVNRDKHYADILSLLTQFNEAHIMIGHTHYPQNFIHSGYVCKGGKPIYEHIHQAACGAWWASQSSVTGAPNGYNIYEVNGATIENWVNKGTNRDASYQVRVYDGNQTYTGKKGYTYNWYKEANVGGTAGITAVGYPALKDCFVAEVWDDDDSYCKVEFWQGGVKKGDFVRVPNGSCANIAICSYYFNELSKNTDTWVNKTASHYWYYKPASGSPSSETDWEVRVTRRIFSGGRTNVYTCNKLTTDYSEF